MNALAFAWRSLIRQPARSILAILGVAAIGALLFDMLLLSEGLLLSMRAQLDRMGFDLRVTSTDDIPRAGPDLADGAAIAEQIAMLSSVRSVLTIRTEAADLQHGDRVPTRATFLGAGRAAAGALPWTILRGRDVAGGNELVINRHAARVLDAEPGDSIAVSAFCSKADVAPPRMTFRVVGVAEFPFDTASSGAGTTAETLARACADDPNAADFLAVVSAGDPLIASEAITTLRPDLRVLTNEQLVGRLQQGGFTYFRQISTVLTTITMSFALLLIAVLLTVSVNQRLGEVAALRALGFSQRRVVLDVLCESALIVGIGGVLSLPLGALLAVWLDAILKRMPGIPVDLHFFVFEPEALAMQAALLTSTAILAALYPMHIVARLPIAATLRDEVVS